MPSTLKFEQKSTHIYRRLLSSVLQQEAARGGGWQRSIFFLEGKERLSSLVNSDSGLGSEWALPKRPQHASPGGSRL